MAWLTLIKGFLGKPKLLAGAGGILLIVAAGFYLNHRQGQYEGTIADLESQVRFKDAAIMAQKLEIEKHKNDVSRKIEEQRQKLEKAREKAQEEISERDARIDYILSNRPEITPENACIEAEGLIDKVLFGDGDE